MIITIFISMVGFLAQGIQNILPVSPLPGDFSTALTTVVVAINGLSYILPVVSILNALYIVIGYEIAVWGFYGVLWAWRRLPFMK